MDHVVYVTGRTLDELLAGDLTWLSYPISSGWVHAGDKLFFAPKQDKTVVTAWSRVQQVRTAPRVHETTPYNLVDEPYRAGKMMLIEVTNPERLTPFAIQPAHRGDEWLVVGDIECVKVA